MNRIARNGLVALAAISVGAVLVYVLSEHRLNKRYPVSERFYPVPSDDGARSGGEHLVKAVGICANCHGADLGGGVQLDSWIVGRLASPNLTSGRGGVTRNYGDDDWFRAIRHGIRPTGKPLLLMPSGDYQKLSVAEVAEMIAWLKTAPPVDREVAPSRPGPLMRIMLALGRLPDLVSAERIDHGAQQDLPDSPISHGQRLAGTCTGCHGDGFSGGSMAAAPPGTPPPSNLTQDRTGLKEWSESDFDRALRRHQDPSGRELNAFMPTLYRDMSDEEVRAIWSFLLTVPPRAFGHR